MSDKDDNGRDIPAGASLETDLAEVETMIRNARRALAGGDLLDMTPLGERVASLCQNVRSMALTASDPDTLRERLENMVLDLNRLEEEIRAGAEQNGGIEKE